MKNKDTLKLDCGTTISYSIMNWHCSPDGHIAVHRFHISDSEDRATIDDIVVAGEEHGEGEEVTINIEHKSLPSVIAFLQRALKEKP